MYAKLVTTVFKKNTTYRLTLLFRILTTIISVLATRQVWSILYRDGSNAGGFTLSTMLTYVTIAMILQAFYSSSIAFEISSKIQTGGIVQDFQRPWSFQAAMFAYSFGSVLAGIVSVVLPILIVTLVLFPIDVPSNPLAILYFFVSILLGLIINFCIQFLIGMLSFIFVEVWGFEIIVGLTVSLLSGQLIPLAFFPEGLSNVVNYLPFRGLYSIPISIYTETIVGSIWNELLYQGIWALGLWLLISLTLKYFQRVLTVAGG
ncbi:ABC-2 family transporter protein [Paenibacillus sp. FSL H8-0537]|uniref:ABC transporter permease n=1 Tax=Paenibacillus sp. FSL H8-0537 TaxID=2921399 RepID=UPI0031010096